VGLAAYTIAMGYALVYSGEHFVTDILAGWLMAGFAYALVTAAVRAASVRVRRRAAARAPAAVPAPAPAASR
jgi:membrane-associated phospholipid phosphatase